MSKELNPRPDRRTAIKWMLAAAASTTVIGKFRLEGAESAGAPTPVSAKGYGTDPDMMKAYKPGDVWPLTFTDKQRATAAALCAVIIPAEGDTPSAAELNVHDFVDEWISAPYPSQQEDRPVVIDGLAWIEAESQKRFGKSFADLAESESHAICDDIAYPSKAATQFKEAAQFFSKFRHLTAGGFYSTPEGSRDIGYVGNVALGAFEGPPPEVLEKLGVTQI